MILNYFELIKKIKTKELNLVEYTTNFLRELDKYKNLNIFITIAENSAINSAIESQKRFDSGNPRKLEGMFFVIKDNISTKDIRTTCSSKMLEDFIPVYDATVVTKIKNEGGIIIGKANMDEFAMGSSNENSYFGTVLNPLNEEYVIGGSSGGSAAAVVAKLCHIALGSETGGSVRQPASFGGIYGYKPSYGMVSRFGLVAFASSLDQIGVFSSDLETMSLSLDIITGNDKNDSTSTPNIAFDFSSNLNTIRDNLKIGYIGDSLLNNCENYIIDSYKSLIRKLEEEGHDLFEVEVKYSEAWIPTYYIVATAEASSNLARFDGIRYGFSPDRNEGEDLYVKTRSEGFGPEVKRRIMLGTYVLSSGFYDAYYKKAMQMRTKVKQSYNNVFEKADCIIMPTTPSSAFKQGSTRNKQPLKMYQSDFFTASANLAGIPAINLPFGINPINNLPFGIQLQANNFEDIKLIQIAQELRKTIQSN